MIDSDHHDWSWKTQTVDDVEYVCVEFVERCAAEQGLSLSIRALTREKARWLPVHAGPDADHWFYVPREEVLTRLSEVSRRWTALHETLVIL